MESVDNILNSPLDCQIITTRVVNFPINNVFEVWSNPEYLKNWWGPHGFTNTFHTFEFFEGGKWNFIMHGPDSTDYLNECEFIKIEKPTTILFKHISQPNFYAFANLELINDTSTKVTYKMFFDNPEICAQIKSFAQGKNEELFDKLELELRKFSL